MKLITETDDVYSDADKKIEYYDTSNFPKNTKFNITPGTNEKEPGLLKFDNAENGITELICKASKSYREKRLNGDIFYKLKGIKNANKIGITDENFKSESFKVDQTSFQSNDLQIKK